jgi:hypothetical protein
MKTKSSSALPCHMRTKAKFPYQRWVSPAAARTTTRAKVVKGQIAGVSWRKRVAWARGTRAAASAAEIQWNTPRAGSPVIRATPAFQSSQLWSL